MRSAIVGRQSNLAILVNCHFKEVLDCCVEWHDIGERIPSSASGSMATLASAITPKSLVGSCHASQIYRQARFQCLPAQNPR